MDKDTIKKVYQQLKGVQEEIITNEVDKRVLEEKIKDEIASEMDYKDKDGNTDPKKVKTPLLKGAIAIKYKEKQDKKEVEFDTQTQYGEIITNSSKMNTDLIDSYVKKEDEISDLKKDIKEILSENPEIDMETAKAILKIIKEDTNDYKNDLLEKSGFPVKVKDTSKIKEEEDLVKKILSLLK